MAGGSRWPGPDSVPRRTNPLTVAAAAIPAIFGIAILLFGVFAQAATRATTSTRSGSGGSGWFLFIAGTFVILGAVVAVLRWWTTTYTVNDHELIVDSGLLSRDHRVLPFDRVQQADTHQNIVGQVLRLTELRVDSAGVAGATQIKLRLLDDDSAQALRNYLLLRRAELQAQQAAQHAPSATQATASSTPGLPVPPGHVGYTPPGFLAPEVPVLALAPGRLALAALTHSSLVIAIPSALVVGGWVAAFAAAGRASNSAVVGMLAGVPLVVGVAVLFALLLTFSNVIGFYGWTVSLAGDEIHLRYGLFEKRNLTIPRRRVQQVTFADNPVRRMLGLVELSMHTAAVAGGQNQQATTSFRVPILRRSEVDAFVTQMMGDHTWAVPELTPRGSAARRRGIVRRVLCCGLLAAGPAIALRPIGYVLFGLAALGVPWGLSAHKRAGHGLSATVVAVSHGVLHHRVDLVPVSRVQSCRTEANPMQRWSKLATFLVDTAGARLSPFLWDMDEATARGLARSIPRYSKP